MLIVNDIFKSYQNVQAVHDLSFQVPKGSIFGLLGPNGAGKTTFLRILNGIYQADQGSITWNDTALSTEWIANHVGYLPEERGLYPKMKVRETLRYFARIRGVTDVKQLDAKIHQALTDFDILEKESTAVEKLSKGMQQKIQIIATLLHDPDLIILDEPFTGLDPVNTRLLKDMIRDLAQQGKTIILSTHRMEQVEALCDTITLIHQGSNVLSGSVSDIKLSYRTNTYYLKTTNSVPSSVPGDIIQRSDNEITFKLGEGQAIEGFLQSVISAHDVIEFKEIFPSLEDIFVQKVTTEHHAE